jgi:hypothetical protein
VPRQQRHPCQAQHWHALKSRTQSSSRPTHVEQDEVGQQLACSQEGKRGRATHHVHQAEASSLQQQRQHLQEGRQAAAVGQRAVQKQRSIGNQTTAVNQRANDTWLLRVLASPPHQTYAVC